LIDRLQRQPADVIVDSGSDFCVKSELRQLLAMARSLLLGGP
jgi:hypothetical protein